MDRDDVEGQVAVVTGRAQPIGFVIAGHLVASERR